jgi:Concanavalin A-like lectin/glucanases superfamily
VGCRVYFGITDCGNATLALNSATKLNMSTWYHLVATFDGTAAVLYVNGTMEGSASNSQPMLPMDNANFVLGVRVGGSFGSFRGSLDEAAVYPRALTAGEVASHFVTATRP